MYTTLHGQSKGCEICLKEGCKQASAEENAVSLKLKVLL